MLLSLGDANGAEAGTLSSVVRSVRVSGAEHYEPGSTHGHDAMLG
jgi:hypothetical protein